MHRFHRPIEGETGYVPQDEKAVKANMSSLAQIVSCMTKVSRETMADVDSWYQTAAPATPLTPYPESEVLPTGLTASHLKYLAKYLSPSYLSASNLERLAGQFVEGSEVVMHNFLNTELVSRVKAELETEDAKYSQFEGRIADQDFGERSGWTLKGPASKHRYLSLNSKKGLKASTPVLQSILTELYPSPAFRAWLQVISSLVVLAYTVEARRFRKGLDYTLAHGEPKDAQPRLDGTLGLSWWATEAQEQGENENDETDIGGWEVSYRGMQGN